MTNALKLSRTLLLIALFCSSLGTASATETESAEVIFVGTFRSPFTKPANPEPEPKNRLGAGWIGPRPSVETRSVHAKRGLDFGLLFIPRGGKNIGTPVTLKYITRFPQPGMLEPGRKMATQSSASSIDCLNGMVCTARYIFDSSWEMIPGVWHFEVYSGGEKIVNEEIEVLPPSAENEHAESSLR